MKTMKTMGP